MSTLTWSLRLTAVTLLTAWLAAACGGPATPPGSTPAGGATATPGAGEPATRRTAILSEIKNSADARALADADWTAATVGEQITAGGGVRTGEEARVRIETSEGSVIRIAANTIFELADFSPDPQDPVTKLQLEAGQVWVWVTKALGAGSFEVETPSGVATVRGSLMSVAYDPATGRLQVECAEGQCTLADRLRQNVVALAEGERSEIPAAGQGPLALRRIDRAQLRVWLTEFPEVRTLIQRLVARAEAEATATPPAGQTACDHPFFPMRAGATWSYETANGPMTWTITAVTGDQNQATADMTYVMSGVTGTYHWQCTSAGLVSYDFGTLTALEGGQLASLTVTDGAGVWLPAAETLTVGYAWTSSYAMQMSVDLGDGNLQAIGDTTVLQDLQVVDREPVTVADQALDGLRVLQQRTQTTQTAVGNFTGPATEFSSTTTLVFARGVGIVTMSGTDGLSQLVSYSVP
ncbi:MAG: FecR domain-containing protein [Anaerolineales bacterium]|nr:FecR domain-containing protein [Anaerolineales bacterium]